MARQLHPLVGPLVASRRFRSSSPLAQSCLPDSIGLWAYHPGALSLPSLSRCWIRSPVALHCCCWGRLGVAALRSLATRLAFKRRPTRSLRPTPAPPCRRNLQPFHVRPLLQFFQPAVCLGLQLLVALSAAGSGPQSSGIFVRRSVLGVEPSVVGPTPGISCKAPLRSGFVSFIPLFGGALRKAHHDRHDGRSGGSYPQAGQTDCRASGRTDYLSTDC